ALQGRMERKGMGPSRSRRGTIECHPSLGRNDFVAVVLRSGATCLVVCRLAIEARTWPGRGPVVMDRVDDSHADLFAPLCGGPVADDVEECPCPCLDHDCSGSIDLGP